MIEQRIGYVMIRWNLFYFNQVFALLLSHFFLLHALRYFPSNFPISVILHIHVCLGRFATEEVETKQTSRNTRQGEGKCNIYANVLAIGKIWSEQANFIVHKSCICKPNFFPLLLPFSNAVRFSFLGNFRSSFSSFLVPISNSQSPVKPLEQIPQWWPKNDLAQAIIPARKLLLLQLLFFYFYFLPGPPGKKNEHKMGPLIRRSGHKM